MHIENLEVNGFAYAIKGMRNSFASWDKSDSLFDRSTNTVSIGTEDMKLMKHLAKRGGSERKYLRMIQVWCDIWAPFYWWKQFDTYKIGTVALSESTMHSIMLKPLKIVNFEYSEYDIDWLSAIVDILNDYISKYQKVTDPEIRNRYFEMVNAMLPQSYIQHRTVNMNYETLIHIIQDRHNHRLSIWHDFCDYMLDNAPCLAQIIGYSR